MFVIVALIETGTAYRNESRGASARNLFSLLFIYSARAGPRGFYENTSAKTRAEIDKIGLVGVDGKTTLMIGRSSGWFFCPKLVTSVGNARATR